MGYEISMHPSYILAARLEGTKQIHVDARIYNRMCCLLMIVIIIYLTSCLFLNPQHISCASDKGCIRCQVVEEIEELYMRGNRIRIVGKHHTIRKKGLIELEARKGNLEMFIHLVAPENS